MHIVPPASSSTGADDRVERLDSWKEIGGYLKRDISTVQRWEKREGMPVHRHRHDKRGSVYAFSHELDAWWQSRRTRLERETAEPPLTALPATADARGPRGSWTTAGVVAAGALVSGLLGFWLGRPVETQPADAPRLQRLTERPGFEQHPALSPDGRSVAFVASVNGRRQVFVRLLAGGTPLQVTRADADHLYPRWTPDSSALIVFTPAQPGERQGAVWRVSALGGEPRRVLSSLSGADVSGDGRLATFVLASDRVELVRAARDGSAPQPVTSLPIGVYYRSPRWSPDGHWIAFERGDGVRFDLFVVPASGGEPRRITDDSSTSNGVTWSGDGRTLVYASSRASTMPYVPAFALWEVALDGRGARRLAMAESGYEHPDIDATTGRLVVSRLTTRGELWRFPVDGAPADNVRAGMRLTDQTGQVRTPTVAPDDREIAFIADIGGHANLWVLATATGALRQLTHETSEDGAVGVPVWSPDGRSIAFVSSRGRRGFAFGVWTIKPDGSQLRQMAATGWGPAWSNDGRWLYFVDGQALWKVPAEGGSAVIVRAEPARNVIGAHGTTLYFMVERPLVDGTPQFEVHAATPEIGVARVLGRFSAARVASWQVVNPSLSPDGRWLAVPLTDGDETNVWLMSTEGGAWRQVTDFGERRTLIARRVSWTSDGKFIVAAVSDGDADVVMLEGLWATGAARRDR